jgi:hypothetical protein
MSRLSSSTAISLRISLPAPAPAMVPVNLPAADFDDRYRTTPLTIFLFRGPRAGTAVKIKPV